MWGLVAVRLSVECRLPSEAMTASTSPAAPLWTPSPERVATSNLDAFRHTVNARFDLALGDSDALHAWCVAEPASFWSTVWDVTGILGDQGSVVIEPGTFLGTRFFPEASLNFAENLLVGPADSSEVAIAFEREDGLRRRLTWEQLRWAVASLAAEFRRLEVQPGDRVAAWMPNMPETIIAMLAASAVGAVFTSTSPDFGTAGVVDRFGQVAPVVLVAADGYTYGAKRHDCLARLAEIVDQLPTVRQVIVVGNLADTPSTEGIARAVTWADAVAPHGNAELSFVRLPFDHPLYILYSSGTTGKPKCIEHRQGGILLMHRKEQQLQSDMQPSDRVFYYTTCGWMMWNWLASVLAAKATVVLYDGSPFIPGPTRLFDLAERYDLSLLGVSAKFIDACRKAGIRPIDTHQLGSLRMICSTGSPLSDDSFRYIYDAVATDVQLQSMSGGTDLCGCLVGGDTTKPVYVGQLQRPAIGLAVDVFNADGSSSAAGVKGELVCTKPFPSAPLRFLGDEDGARYHAAYFDRFPDVWAQGDFASWTDEGGMIIYGRSDATLNAGGVRIGTAELYREVENFEEIVEAIAVGQDWDSDTRIVLFVRMADGVVLTPQLEAAIRARLRDNCTPRHVPARIIAVADIPRTRSNKITELAVADVINGRVVRNREALANPEALDLFANLPELAT
jgi:acetoacetyl-CoA synthetase